MGWTPLLAITRQGYVGTDHIRRICSRCIIILSRTFWYVKFLLRRKRRKFEYVTIMFNISGKFENNLKNRKILIFVFVNRKMF